MRIAFAIALIGATFAAQRALAEDTAQPAPSSVTVNLGALPAPAPRHKPSPEQIRALTVPLPRHKPAPEAIAADAAPTAAPAPSPTAAAGVALLPRPKPQLATAEAPHKPKAPPLLGSEAAPAQETALTSPQNAAAVAEALRASTMSAPPPRPLNPTAGFSMLTRLTFRTGNSDLGDDAKVQLDALATRLLGNEERVRLAAFSGQAGDTSSGAHRLSLARALSVRTYLVSKGVPISRVDVLAFGASADGTTDRVDILVRDIKRRTGKA